MEKQTISISTDSLVKVTLLIVALLLVFYIRDLLLMFFTALIFAIAFDRPIDKICEKKVPRVLSAFIVYLVIFSVVGGILYLVLPPLAIEIRNLAFDYNLYLERFIQTDEIPFVQVGEETLDLSGLFGHLSEVLAQSARTVLGTLFSVFGGLLSFVIIIFFALFLNTQEKGVKRFIFYLTPKKHQEYILSLFDKIQIKVGNWLWGRVISSVFVGILILAGLLLLKIPFALTLAVLAFILNFVLFIGPIIASVPAILLALTVSIPHALAVMVLYVFVNNVLEAFVFMPLLMKKAVDMNPALLLLVILVGARLAGVLGVIVAIPAAAIIAILIDEYMAKRMKQADKHLHLV